MWRPLGLWNEIWTVGPQNIPCATHCVYQCAVLLEDEPSGQPVIVLKEP